MHEIQAIIRSAEMLNANHTSSEFGFDPFAPGADEEIENYNEDEKEFVALLSALGHHARMEFMALMWIGRDFDGDFDDALKYARENSDNGDVPSIAEKSPTYLRNELQAIGLLVDET